jgi:RNA polymerase sigma-70 factor, ECF subfamily
MNGSNPEDTHRTGERVAGESYGRLVAYLSSHTRDVASVEGALGNALVAALTAWPRDGVAQNSEAWLLTTARHSLIDLMRHQQVALASEPTLLLLQDEPKEATLSAEFPDERRSCSSCAPTRRSIRPCSRPLCSRPSLGLDAVRIAPMPSWSHR